MLPLYSTGKGKFWAAYQFRVSHPLFLQLVSVLRPSIERDDTNFRQSIKAEVKIAAFLSRAGGERTKQTAARLGIGQSTVTPIIREGSREINTNFQIIFDYHRVMMK